MTNIEDYLLNVNFNTNGIPPEAFVAFPESFGDEELRNAVIKRWKVGQDNLYGHIVLAKHPQAEAIFRPVKVKVDLEQKDITLFTPSGLEAHASIMDFHDKDVESIL